MKLFYFEQHNLFRKIDRTNTVRKRSASNAAPHQPINKKRFRTHTFEFGHQINQKNLVNEAKNRRSVPRNKKKVIPKQNNDASRTKSSEHVAKFQTNSPLPNRKKKFREAESKRRTDKHASQFRHHKPLGQNKFEFKEFNRSHDELRIKSSNHVAHLTQIKSKSHFRETKSSNDVSRSQSSEHVAQSSNKKANCVEQSESIKQKTPLDTLYREYCDNSDSDSSVNTFFNINTDQEDELLKSDEDVLEIFPRINSCSQAQTKNLSVKDVQHNAPKRDTIDRTLPPTLSVSIPIEQFGKAAEAYINIDGIELVTTTSCSSATESKQTGSLNPTSAFQSVQKGEVKFGSERKLLTEPKLRTSKNKRSTLTTKTQNNNNSSRRNDIEEIPLKGKGPKTTQTRSTHRERSSEKSHCHNTSSRTILTQTPKVKTATRLIEPKENVTQILKSVIVVPSKEKTATINCSTSSKGEEIPRAKSPLFTVAFLQKLTPQGSIFKLKTQSNSEINSSTTENIILSHEKLSPQQYSFYLKESEGCTRTQKRSIRRSILNGTYEYRLQTKQKQAQSQGAHSKELQRSLPSSN